MLCTGSGEGRGELNAQLQIVNVSGLLAMELGTPEDLSYAKAKLVLIERWTILGF